MNDIVIFFIALRYIKVLLRARKVSSFMTRPKKTDLYLACLGVSPKTRLRGVGSQIMHHHLNICKERGYKRLRLDVSVD